MLPIPFYHLILSQLTVTLIVAHVCGMTNVNKQRRIGLCMYVCMYVCRPMGSLKDESKIIRGLSCI